MSSSAKGKKIGLFPASFDPVTNGHMDIIVRATKLVDRLVTREQALRLRRLPF